MAACQISESLVETSKDVCLTCQEGFEVKVRRKVTAKGAATLLSASRIRKDARIEQCLVNYLGGDISGNVYTLYIHQDCQRDYTNKLRLKRFAEQPHSEEPKPKKMRSCNPSFNWKENYTLENSLSYYR